MLKYMAVTQKGRKKVEKSELIIVCHLHKGSQRFYEKGAQIIH